MAEQDRYSQLKAEEKEKTLQIAETTKKYKDLQNAFLKEQDENTKE